MRHESSHVLIMKVGTHADENLANVVKRKRHEEQSAGHCFWGYGGALCHPTRQVQLHAEHAHGNVRCLFIPTTSNPHLNVTYASEYSPNGTSWHSLPVGHVVTSSKWALTFTNLQVVDFAIDLCSYVVSVGPSAGRNLADYLRGRSDKACAVLADQQDAVPAGPQLRSVMLTAHLVAPYAVFLR